MKAVKWLIPFLSVCWAAAAAQENSAAVHGREVFEHLCAPCHGTGPGDDGAPMLPGTHAIALKYRGEKPPLLQDRTDINYEFVKSVVRSGLASMPPFRKTELTDSDIAAIMTYFNEEQ
jgi:mono/diheme cytochrome c family protein